MTTKKRYSSPLASSVVEAYRLGRYDNLSLYSHWRDPYPVVEAYRLGRYDNLFPSRIPRDHHVVEAYRLGRYDNRARSRVAVILAVVEAYRLGRYDNSVLNVILLPFMKL